MKEKVVALVSDERFSFALIALVFFFAWSDLLIDGGFFLQELMGIADWPLMLLGLLIPFVLLVAAVQYNSPIAYALTLAIFTFTILINVSTIPYYLSEYYYEKEHGMTNCSCCPECVIKETLGFVLLNLLAIFLMNRKKMLTAFKWKRIYSLQLMFLILGIYFGSKWIW